MKTHPLRLLTLGLACACTSAAVLMSGASAAERGATHWDVAIVCIWAVLLALGAHLIPVLTQRLSAGGRALGWAAWAGCMAAALYGHAHFFIAAQERAGTERASAVAAPAAGASVAQELAAIHARPLATVAADQAQADAAVARADAALAQCAKEGSRCPQAQARLAVARSAAQALGLELSEAQRAATLRARQTELIGQTDAARTAAAADQVDAALARALGISPATVGLLVAVGQSLLLDVMAALLWTAAVTEKEASAAAAPSATAMSTEPGLRQRRPRPGFPARLKQSDSWAPATPTARATTTHGGTLGLVSKLRTWLHWQPRDSPDSSAALHPVH